MAEQFIASRTLPHVLQSTKLKNFFDSTVDQWFKNENSTFEKGFVGQRQGRLLNTTKDSYIAEPTVDRINYQLEPAMTLGSGQNLCRGVLRPLRIQLNPQLRLHQAPQGMCHAQYLMLKCGLRVPQNI